MKPILSIITVSYGQAREVNALLKSLKKFPPADTWELIVVDNNSPRSQNYDFLSSEKNTHLIQLNQNIGFGKGNEEAVRFAQGKILAFVNPDIEIQKGTLDELLQVLRTKKEAGITVPLLETKKGKILENTWNFPTFWSLLRRRIWKPTTDILEINNKKEIFVDWAQGSF